MAAAVVTEVDPERIKAKARYQKMKGYELQKLLRADGKDPNGTKPQLVARLLDLIAPPPPPMPAQAMAAAPPPVVASSSSDDENDPEKQQQRQLWQQQQEEQQQELEPELHRAGRQAERMETVAEQQEGAEAACRAKYEACNEKQLRSLCASSWLDESGDKLALVERLVAYDEPEDGRAAPPPPQRRSPPATAQPAQGVSSVQASQQAVGDRASEKAEMGTLVEDKEQEEKEKEKEKAAEKAIRAELRPLKMRTLHRRAVAAVVEQRRGGGANEDKDDEEEDEDEVEEAAETTVAGLIGTADDPKHALVELLVRHQLQSLAADGAQSKAGETTVAAAEMATKGKNGGWFKSKTKPSPQPSAAAAAAVEDNQDDAGGGMVEVSLDGDAAAAAAAAATAADDSRRLLQTASAPASSGATSSRGSQEEARGQEEE